MLLSVVIPVYNEAQTFEIIFERIKKAKIPRGIRREYVIVDDCSTDKTGKVLEKYQKEKRVSIYFHSKNMGKGAALHTGFEKAKGEYILIQDADLEYDPNEYAKLLGPILKNKADVVYGSRYLGGQPNRVLQFWHSFMNRFLTFFSNMLSDIYLTDMETCYKVFRKNLLKNFSLEEKGFGFEPEITAKFAELSRSQNIKIYEVAVSYHARTYEEGKKINWKDAVRAFWCILIYNHTLMAHLSKYLVNGFFIILLQFASMILLVRLSGFEGDLENLANAISIGVTLFASFILHSWITWRYSFKSILDVIMKLLLFMAIFSFVSALRIYVYSYFLDMGMSYVHNTLIGIFIAVAFNFLGYDKIVFKERPG